MRFLFPAFLVGALMVALPVILHLLRKDVAPDVPFTAVHLLRPTTIERSHRRRLRDVLLLAARVTALLLLALAFARPYLAAATSAGPLTIVALDRSLSMGAPGVWARARTMAQQAVDAAGGRVAVLALDRHIHLVSPPGAATEARGALERLQAVPEGARYESAFEQAADLAEGAAARLVLVTDLQRTGIGTGPLTLSKNITLIVGDAGGGQGNVAVTGVRIEGRRVVATLRNFGAAPRPGRARLVVDRQRQDEKTFTAAPGAAAVVAFDRVVTPGAEVAVAIDDAGGYPLDDQRFAIAGADAPPGVLIVGGVDGSMSGFYLARALEATGDEGSSSGVQTIGGLAFSRLEKNDISQRVLVVLSTHGMNRQAGSIVQRFLARGRGVLIAAGPDVDPGMMSLLTGAPGVSAARQRDGVGPLTAIDTRHPVFQAFGPLVGNFGGVTFDRAWQFEPAPGQGWRTLASFGAGQPALLERVGGSGRMLLFTSDMDRRWNDLPLHAAFVPFAQEAIRYLGGDPVVSAVLVSDAPPGVRARPGFATDPRTGRRMALNVDLAESTVERMTPDELVAALTRTDAVPAGGRVRGAAGIEARQSYWKYGLALMLVALVGESFLGKP